MLFELHLTTDTHQDFDGWKSFWLENGAKPLLIELFDLWDLPEHPVQPMMSATFVGQTTEAYDWMYQLTSKALGAGFPIVRQKLEVPLDKSGEYEGRVAYYEAHVKSLIPHKDVAKITLDAIDANWHASWNAWHPDDQGLEKWYFTQRVYVCRTDVPNFIQAGREFAESFNTLTEINWHTVRLESEAVIYDSAPGLDKGWAENGN